MDCLTDKGLAVADHARSQLLRNPYLALRNIHCDFREGVLTLIGCLPTYHLKQVAQTAVAALDGVERIVNAIEVLPATAR